MLGGHIWELAIILGLALVVFGPKRLPEIGGALGKGIREFKQGTSELSDSVTASHETQSPLPVAVPVAVIPPPAVVRNAIPDPPGSPLPPSYPNAG